MPPGAEANSADTCPQEHTEQPAMQTVHPLGWITRDVPLYSSVFWKLSEIRRYHFCNME